MSAARTGRKRAREFKLGGQRAQQVQQARVNAVAAQFDKLAPALRTPALAALHSRCKGSEKATLARLYYREQIAAAGARGKENFTGTVPDGGRIRNKRKLTGATAGNRMILHLIRDTS